MDPFVVTRDALWPRACGACRGRGRGCRHADILALPPANPAAFHFQCLLSRRPATCTWVACVTDGRCARPPHLHPHPLHASHPPRQAYDMYVDDVAVDAPEGMTYAE